MKRLMVAVVLAGLAAGCGMMNKGDDGEGTTETTISMNEVPAAVSAAFAKDFPDAKVSKVEKETYADGTVHYEFEWTDAAGAKKEVEYNTDGDQLDEH